MDVKEILAYVCFAGLDDSPAPEALESKSSPPPGLLNGIPYLSICPKKQKRLDNKYDIGCPIPPERT